MFICRNKLYICQVGNEATNKKQNNMEDLFKVLGLNFDPINELNKFDEHLSKREQLDHELAISILNNKLAYWIAIKNKTCPTRSPEAYESVTDTIDQVKNSIQKLRR